MKIPVIYKNSTPKNEFSGSCNIRIYRARFGLTGLIAKKSTRVAVILRHGGGEIIVDRKDVGHRFVHDPISILYSFYLSTDGSINVLDNGNIAEADVDEPVKHYAAPGLFADDWTVNLTQSEHLDLLDFSNVTEAYFDFCGTNYAF